MQKKRDELKDLKAFGITLAAILIIFGAIHFLKHRIILSQWFGAVGLVILCLAILAPRTLKRVYAIFLKAAHAIGWFNTRLILIIMYYFLVTPIAILVRLFGKDPLNRKIDKNALTYWVSRPIVKTSKEQLEKQF